LFSQDDVLNPNCLEAEARFHRRHPEVAMAHSLYDVIDASGAIIIPSEKPEQPAVFSPEFASQMMFYYGCLPGNISNVSLKRSVVRLCLAYFARTTFIAGDFEIVGEDRRRALARLHRPALLSVRSHSDQLSKSTCALGDRYARKNAIV